MSPVEVICKRSNSGRDYLTDNAVIPTTAVAERFETSDNTPVDIWRKSIAGRRKLLLDKLSIGAWMKAVILNPIKTKTATKIDDFE
jgi:hypothetical protein